MATILMISTKVGTLGILKIKVFQNKGCYVLTSVQDVANKILSRDKLYCRCDHMTKV